MKMSGVILFLAEFTDERGVGHHAIHKYHPTSGIVDMMKDFKDKNLSYPLCDAETWQYEQDSKRYRLVEGKDKISVVDTVADKTVAVFYDSKLASEYCEQMNLDDKYADKLEDDPWL